MKWSNESTGMKALRPFAESQLRNSKNKIRVWSDHYSAWGFFCDQISMFDEFLVWCSIKPGDRILLDPFRHQEEIFTVVKIWRDEEVREVPLWVFRLLGSNSKIFDIKIKEKELFAEAAKLI